MMMDSFMGWMLLGVMRIERQILQDQSSVTGLPRQKDVTPVETGVQIITRDLKTLDSDFCRNDGKRVFALLKKIPFYKPIVKVV
jgi:hypothetical protein